MWSCVDHWEVLLTYSSYLFMVLFPCFEKYRFKIYCPSYKFDFKGMNNISTLNLKNQGSNIQQNVKKTKDFCINKTENYMHICLVNSLSQLKVRQMTSILKNYKFNTQKNFIFSDNGKLTIEICFSCCSVLGTTASLLWNTKYYHPNVVIVSAILYFFFCKNTDFTGKHANVHPEFGHLFFMSVLAALISSIRSKIHFTCWVVTWQPKSQTKKNDVLSVNEEFIKYWQKISILKSDY